MKRIIYLFVTFVVLNIKSSLAADDDNIRRLQVGPPGQPGPPGPKPPGPKVDLINPTLGLEYDNNADGAMDTPKKPAIKVDRWPTPTQPEDYKEHCCKDKCCKADHSCNSGKKGLTYARQRHDYTLGIEYVGCGSTTAPVTDNGDYNCDPYRGDTYCCRKLPVLCHKPKQLLLERPCYDTYNFSPGQIPTPARPADYYQGWTGSTVYASSPRKGSDFTHIGEVNSFCATQFGPGYKVFEFHETWWRNGMSNTQFCANSWNWNNVVSGGWNLRAYGYLGTCTAFWIDINDQPNGTCWARKAPDVPVSPDYKEL